MKKTLIAVACAALISTGAYARPAQHAPQSHTNHHSIHAVSHNTPKPASHAKHHVNSHHASHHRPAPIVASVRPTPPPPHHHHHHHHSHLDVGDALIAFAILASAAF